MSPPPRPRGGVLLLSQLRRDLDSLFQEMVAAGGGLGPPATWRPRTDVLELPEAVLVLVEVPGLGPEDLEVRIEGPLLHIHGRRRLAPPGAQTGRFHCLERPGGTFLRQVELTVPVNSAAARAELRLGVLAIELPRLEDRRRVVHPIPIVESQEEQ